MTRPHSTEQSLFLYCPYCGTKLKRGTEGRFLRTICPDCDYVQYRNPIVGVAAVITEDDVVSLVGQEVVLAVTGQPAVPGRKRIMLARRAATYSGLYCIPCGYVEFDEDVREALVREVEEETGIKAETGEIVAVQSNFHDADNQSVGIWFRVRPVGGVLRPGDDVDKLIFAPVPDPGVPLAFPTDARVLESLAR